MSQKTLTKADIPQANILVFISAAVQLVTLLALFPLLNKLLMRYESNVVVRERVLLFGSSFLLVLGLVVVGLAPTIGLAITGKFKTEEISFSGLDIGTQS